LANFRKKKRYTPMEIAKILKISMGRFSTLVKEGSLPKGRIGDDGKRYYTDKDLDYILRKWKTQSTGRFLMYTLPLMLILVLLIVMTVIEVSDRIRERNLEPTPSPPTGFGAPPPQYFAPGTEWPSPTASSTPTPRYDKLENYRSNMLERNRKRDMQRRSIRRQNRPKLYKPE